MFNVKITFIIQYATQPYAMLIIVASLAIQIVYDQSTNSWLCYMEVFYG